MSPHILIVKFEHDHDNVGDLVLVETSQVLEHNVGIEIMPDESIEVWYLGECKRIPKLTEGTASMEELSFLNLSGTPALNVWVYGDCWGRWDTSRSHIDEERMLDPDPR